MKKNLKFQKNKTYIVFDKQSEIIRKIFIIDLDEISLLAYEIDLNQQGRLMIDVLEIKCELSSFYEYVSVEYTSSYSWRDS